MGEDKTVILKVESKILYWTSLLILFNPNKILYWHDFISVYTNEISIIQPESIFIILHNRGLIGCHINIIEEIRTSLQLSQTINYKKIKFHVTDLGYTMSSNQEIIDKDLNQLSLEL